MTILNDLIYAPFWPTDNFTWLMWISFVFAFAVSYGMGANDACNDWGTSVGAGTVKLWQAYILCAIFNTLGAVLLGYKVTETIRTGIVDISIYDIYVQYDPSNHTYVTVPFCEVSNFSLETTTFAPPTLPAAGVAGTIVECARYTSADFMYGQVGVLLGVSVFMIVSSIFKIPVSATHAIVGATLAATLYLRGNVGIKWAEIVFIIFSWFLSPVIAGFFSSLFYLVVKFSVLMRRHTFESALLLCPVFMVFTLAVNLFACIYQGSKYLGFDKLNWWEALLVALGIAIIVGLIIHFPLRKWLRNRAIRLYEKDKIKYAETGGIPLRSRDISANKVIDVSFTNVDGVRKQLPAGEIEPPPGPWYKYITKNVTEDLLASKVFNALQMVSASLLSFSHGANDTANTVGPLVAIWLTYKTGWALTPAETRDDMQLLLFFGAVAMIFGFATLGHRTMKLIAKEITTEVSAPSGFTVELGTAFTVLFCAKLGIPVSSTHCAVGAVLFVGMTKSTSEGVDWKVFGKIVIVWLLCFPVSALVSFIMTYLLYNYV
ncbi:hypothetical protein PFISCL1PPCAC_28262 [Pristionchus fissidentatus]|uniref:Phosphate transporter n=1 Tax=Pristionchus fissidentatus TaxID=1538716 RepID=A0AAV5WZT2_9BILA|nr:hypothetical protein PFISCL1PPCAC_28262 [Pristionchus fissidentatus]